MEANNLNYHVPSEIRGYWPRFVAKALAENLGPILIFASILLMSFQVVAPGMALGIASLLRDLARDSTGGRCYMPGDVLARHGLAVADVLERSPSPAVLAALAEMRGLARRHVAQARQGRGDAAAVIAQAFLGLALVEPVLRRMDRSGYDPFRTIIDVPQWRRQWAIWRAARK